MTAMETETVVGADTQTFRSTMSRFATGLSVTTALTPAGASGLHDEMRSLEADIP